MTLQEAIDSLKDTTRFELRDHAFGDREVTWTKDRNTVATGYFSGTASEVYIGIDEFKGDDAYALLKVGKLEVERNDETGPDNYVEGETMPGLTLEGVLREITK